MRLTSETYLFYDLFISTYIYQQIHLTAEEVNKDPDLGKRLEAMLKQIIAQGWFRLSFFPKMGLCKGVTGFLFIKIRFICPFIFSDIFNRFTGLFTQRLSSLFGQSIYTFFLILSICTCDVRKFSCELLPYSRKILFVLPKVNNFLALQPIMTKAYHYFVVDRKRFTWQFTSLHSKKFHCRPPN